MSEKKEPPKKCPFRFNSNTVTWDCLEDKCAMWRNEYFQHMPPDEQFQGFCGLAGKP